MRKYGKSNAAAQMDDKGFYIILTICALAIVVSGYVLFFVPSSSGDTVLEDTPSPQVTVPVTVPSVDLTEDEPIERTVEEAPEVPEAPGSPQSKRRTAGRRRAGPTTWRRQAAGAPEADGDARHPTRQPPASAPRPIR